MWEDTDAFAFGLLDGTGTPILTSDPNLADALLLIVIDWAEPGIAALIRISSTPQSLLRALHPSQSPTPRQQPRTLTLVGLSLTSWRARRPSRRRGCEEES